MQIVVDSASLQFVVFGLAVAVVSNLHRSRLWRSAVLLLASMLFIGLMERSIPALLPLAGFLALGYVCLLMLEHRWAISLSWIIAIFVFVYIWLKRYTFLPDAILIHSTYFALGISYIFFRVLHLLIESAERGKERHVGIGQYLLYTLNFTTLVSGPIQRYEEFERDQFALDPIDLGPRVVGLQLERIVRGFFKVNVLASLLNVVRVDTFAQLSGSSAFSGRLYAAFVMYAVYPLFIYANFSGYIDIVIALARLMRIRLPENFDRPFSATSFIDFWNRWHITLSTWLRTYVYNPLLITLSRRFPSRSLEPVWGVCSFFVTFFLVGLWHGRTSEFVLFGILQGLGVVLNKIWQLVLIEALGRKMYKALTKSLIYVALARGLTFTWVAFTLSLFWVDRNDIQIIFNAIGVGPWAGVWLAIWLVAAVVLAIWESLRAALLSVRTSEGPVFTSRYARVAYASALGLIAFIASVLLSVPAPDIVYKAF